MKRILIVGQSFSSLTNYLVRHGYDYIILKDIERTNSPEKKLKKRIVCDFSSKQSILETVAGIDKPIDGIMTTYENYVLPAAWIGEYLRLPALSEKSALACTDKFLMRSLFDDAPEKISPAFAIVKNVDDVTVFARTHAFPLILKPANLAKSLLVTKSNNLEELLANYARSTQHIGEVYEKYAPHRQPKLLIEEFLEGSIHSVDAFVDSEGTPLVLDQIVDYQTGYDIGFDDNFHYSRILPSVLDTQEQAALKHCAELGIRALGMENCPAHVEIIMTSEGPRIVEIGARNGGYRERMHELANVIDITGGAVALALNLPLDITASSDFPCAVLELFSKEPGIFRGIKNEKALRALPSLHYLSVKANIGDYVGKASDGYKMCAIVILHNTDTKGFEQDLRFISEQVSIITRQG